MGHDDASILESDQGEEEAEIVEAAVAEGDVTEATISDTAATQPPSDEVTPPNDEG